MSRGADLPEVPRRPARVRGRRARMREGRIETTVVPRNALDVLAQQIVAIAAPRRAARRASTSCTRSSPAPTPTPSSPRACSRTCSTCSTAATPPREFGELRPRIVWDRIAGTIRPATGARQLAVTNAGTIPDRGLYAVTLPDGRRVGELDEEMVYEARPGQTFLLGASTWRIEEIGRDRVIVTPAPGAPGRGAVLEGRRRRAAAASWARRSGRSRAGRSTSPREMLEREYDLDAAGGAQPARVPARAAGRHPGGAERPHDRRRALPRRDRRLAAVRALARSAAASTPPGASP